MPYITASTHGVNGFYEDALQETKNGRVILYAKRSTDAANNVNERALKDSFNATIDKDYENNFYPIAVTSMIDPVGIQTTLRWEQGGNIIDAFKLGVKSGMNSVTNAAAEIIKNASGAVSEIWNKATGGNDGAAINTQQRKMNMLMRKYRRKVISAASAYKNYGGSDTSINLPQLEFTFPASDFSASHMQRAYTLLSYLLPSQVIKTKAQADKEARENDEIKQEEDTDSSTSTQEENVLNSTYWMYETPPNNYINPAMGFNTSFLEGTFALDVSGTFVSDLIPTAVTLVQSRARVLSANDYYNPGKSKRCMDDFYSSKQLKLMKCGYNGTILDFSKQDSLKTDVGAHGNNNRIPAVVKIYVQFEFAKHITIYDWQEMFFDHINLTNANPYRHDSPLSTFNKGKKAKYISMDKGLTFGENNVANTISSSSIKSSLSSAASKVSSSVKL